MEESKQMTGGVSFFMPKVVSIHGVQLSGSSYSTSARGGIGLYFNTYKITFVVDELPAECS